MNGLLATGSDLLKNSASIKCLHPALLLDVRYNPGMKKLPESISQELIYLSENTLEKFRLPAEYRLDDVFLAVHAESG